MTETTEQCLVEGVCEVTLETSEEPAGNVLELWDFFERDDGPGDVDARASA